MRLLQNCRYKQVGNVHGWGPVRGDSRAGRYYQPFPTLGRAQESQAELKAGHHPGPGSGGEAVRIERKREADRQGPTLFLRL